MDDEDSASVAVDEGGSLDPSVAFDSGHPERAGEDEAAGVAKHIIFDVAGDRVGRGIDRDNSAAVGTAAVVRAMLRVEPPFADNGNRLGFLGLTSVPVMLPTPMIEKPPLFATPMME